MLVTGWGPETATTTHVARIATRNAEMVSAARHYGLRVATRVVGGPRIQGWLGGHCARSQG